jgi:hypothetical protein
VLTTRGKYHYRQAAPLGHSSPLKMQHSAKTSLSASTRSASQLAATIRHVLHAALLQYCSGLRAVSLTVQHCNSAIQELNLVVTDSRLHSGSLASLWYRTAPSSPQHIPYQTLRPNHTATTHRHGQPRPAAGSGRTAFRRETTMADLRRSWTTASWTSRCVSLSMLFASDSSQGTRPFSTCNRTTEESTSG